MKKILCMVIALAMLLSTAALADVASKTNADLLSVKVTSDENITVTAVDSESKGVTKLLEIILGAYEKGENVMDVLPEAVKAVLPDDKEYTDTNEVVVLKMDNVDEETEEVVINLEFATNYAGKKVAMLMGIINGDEDIVDWKSVTGTGKEDGTVDLVLNQSMLDWINGREFIVLVAE